MLFENPPPWLRAIFLKAGGGDWNLMQRYVQNNNAPLPALKKKAEVLIN